MIKAIQNFYFKTLLGEYYNSVSDISWIPFGFTGSEKFNPYPLLVFKDKPLDSKLKYCFLKSIYKQDPTRLEDFLLTVTSEFDISKRQIFCNNLMILIRSRLTELRNERFNQSGFEFNFRFCFGVSFIRAEDNSLMVMDALNDVGFISRMMSMKEEGTIEIPESGNQLVEEGAELVSLRQKLELVCSMRWQGDNKELHELADALITGGYLGDVTKRQVYDIFVLIFNLESNFSTFNSDITKIRNDKRDPFKKMHTFLKRIEKRHIEFIEKEAEKRGD